MILVGAESTKLYPGIPWYCRDWPRVNQILGFCVKPPAYLSVPWVSEKTAYRNK